MPVLARAVGEVGHAIDRGQMTSRHHARFQAVALLAREERARILADTSLTDAQRDNLRKRLEGVATNLARLAARQPSLFGLLQEDAEIGEATRQLKREMQQAGGLEPEPEEEPAATADGGVRPERRTAIPQSVRSAQLANPFLVPDFGAVKPKPKGRLTGWELIGPVLNAFEHPVPGAPACMELPDLPDGSRQDRHQPFFVPPPDRGSPGPPATAGPVVTLRGQPTLASSCGCRCRNGPHSRPAAAHRPTRGCGPSGFPTFRDSGARAIIATS